MRPALRFAAIRRHAGTHPLALMLEHMGVSRSGYYRYLKEADKPPRDGALAAEIEECQTRCRNTYGYRRVTMWLERERNRKVNPKTVNREMLKYGLLSEIRRTRAYQRVGEQLHRYPNLLNRDFEAQRPNQKWVTDISYVGTDEGTLSLSAILDLFDLSVIQHRTGSEQSVNLVTRTVAAALEDLHPTDSLRIHSDQGGQYTSEAYHRLVTGHGLEPSMSRRGNVYDNAMAENFFGILKTECLNRRRFRTRKEAKDAISEYIWFYNHERIQLKTKLAPLEVRRQFC